MFERREQIQKWFYEIVEKFRQKGALTPEKAMTARELDLPPRFETAMKRRLGRSGVFIEVDGKYYLSEERLKQIEELRSQRGGTWNLRNRIMTLRLIRAGRCFSRHHPLSLEPLRPELGTENRFNRRSDCSPTHVHTAVLLRVKNSKKILPADQ